MISGIYLLRFFGTDKVYIGKSNNIEYRYKKHIQKLKNGSHNYKMLQAYNNYGLPTLEILLDNIPLEELSSNELLAFDIFDCVENGLNVCSEATINGSGQDNHASKFSNEKIEEVFRLLLVPTYTYAQISKITQVPISTIRHIACLEAHTWLGEKYPQDYSKLKAIKLSNRKIGRNTAEERGIEYPPIISPDGEEYTVKNITAFAKEHNLDSSSLAKVLKRRPKYNSHKGWKLKK